MSALIQILVVDDHVLFRESLVRLLACESDFQVAGQCASVAEALDILSREAIDLVLLDYGLEDGSGTDLLRALGERRAQAKVLVVTADMSDATTVEVLAAGASGVLLKHSNPACLLEAIHRVCNGEVWLDSRALQAVIAGARNHGPEGWRNDPLTPRERLVLSDILAGLSNKEIAWRLKLSLSTIKNVIQDLFDKAGVHSRSQLVRVVLEQNSGDRLTMNKLQLGASVEM